jgi:hypothetical protein
MRGCVTERSSRGGIEQRGRATLKDELAVERRCIYVVREERCAAQSSALSNLLLQPAEIRMVRAAG